MKKTKKQSIKKAPFWKLLKEEYFNSIKQIKSKRFLGVVGFDLVFYALLFFLSFIFGKIFGKILEPLQKIALTAEATGVPIGNMAETQNAIVVFYGLFILLIILLIFSWGVSRGLIWSWLAKQKIAAKSILKVMLGNLVWFFLWTIPFFVIAKGIYDSYLSGIFIINPKPSVIVLGVFFFVFAYFSYIFYYIIANKQKIFSSIVVALRLGLTRFVDLGLPLLIGIISIIILFSVAELFKIFPKSIQLIISYVIIFGGFSWIKIYAADVFNRVLKDEVK